MKLIHNSHLNGIKSAPDTLYWDGEIKPYWEVTKKVKLPPMQKNLKGRVIYFTLEGWYEWPYGDSYYLDLPGNQLCFAGFACLGRVKTTLAKAEEDALAIKTISNEMKWLNIDKLEIILPIEWIPKELLPSIIYEY